ncbi:MAG: sel1 repeat family protein [Shewanella xiamenensis]|uniref:Tetratricopeptide repeat protein n=1 Tax=Shewanella xiamenensis TaxID=332186 RepID=A0AAE4TQH6_9GAMM|nr:MULTISPECIES: tetratricopeptide repeat protein [Shewanella]MCD8552093.1 sel1 repeat family protein [Shewanella xiamenensis]MCD8560381.1 sel1 repeat family protein [Shewanella xiamenensis]MCT8858145.1 sel1 repeat family protein [Shewanella xiamenensis]MDH0450968.1 sel1 repeat family protein [Shewanella sp. GD04112]MDV5393220.1 tetratricopeptide repeat protein [Shewanella xiamenensis]
MKLRTILMPIVCLFSVTNAVADVDKGFACYMEKNYQCAFKEFLESAEQGDAFAQSEVGSMYGSGKGVKQDYLNAVEWYQKSADQGSEEGQYSLGFAYEYGHGVKQDYVKAVEWYQKAADQGYLFAKQRVLTLNKFLNCSKSAKTELFGVKIKSVSTTLELVAKLIRSI